MPVLGAAARRCVDVWKGGGGPAVIARGARPGQVGVLPRFVRVGRCALSGKRSAEGGREAGSAPGGGVRWASSNAPLCAV